MAVWLLDVNALVALAWEEHAAHRTMIARMSALNGDHWGTSTVTQLGFIRISSMPGILQPAPAPEGARLALSALLTHPMHRFLADSPTPPVDLAAEISVLRGHRQITDAYLIALARHHGAGILTFDRGMHLLAPDRVEMLLQ